MLAPLFTEFMRNVWQIPCGVPYGTTAGYKKIAIAAVNQKSARAAELANNKNTMPLFIPCRRIIDSDRKRIGYRDVRGVKIR